MSCWGTIRGLRRPASLPSSGPPARARRLATPSTATAPAGASRDQLLSRLPSPPGRLPVIGHLHLVGALPHVSLRDLAARHGRDGLLLLRLGAVPTLVVSSAKAAQAVLRTHDHVFASRVYSAVTDILFYGATDVAFCAYGEHWRQVKKRHNAPPHRQEGPTAMHASKRYTTAFSRCRWTWFLQSSVTKSFKCIDQKILSSFTVVGVITKDFVPGS
jgi:hypothetical protein